MKLYIPDLGERIRLIKPWTFNLYCERRNEKLLTEIGKPYGYHYPEKEPGPWPYTVPDGTLLDVDRIYIRKGGDDFSSVSFVILAASGRGRVPETARNSRSQGRQEVRSEWSAPQSFTPL